MPSSLVSLVLVATMGAAVGACFSDGAPEIAARSANDRPLVGGPDVAAPPPDQGPDACELALELEGPCSLACDNAAVVAEFVPAGTCMTFACELADGSTVRVGGCR